MFSRVTTGLVLGLSLILANNAFAQTTQKKTKTKSAQKSADNQKVDEAQRQAALKKAEEEKKAIEAKRAEEAKLAAEKAKGAESSTGFLGYVKSHFSASYHGEYYLQRRDITSSNKEDRDLQDIAIMHNPTLTYRPIKNWKFLATTEFKFADAEKPTFINRHYRSLVTIIRENILTEKEDGIKMDVGVVRRIFDRNHSKSKTYGNFRVNTTLSKKFGDNLSTSALVQYLANDPAKGKIDAKTWKHSLEIIPSFTWQITDKLSYFFNDDFIVNTPWHNDTYGDASLFHEMNVGVVSYQFDDKNSAYFQFKYLHTETEPFAMKKQISDYFQYYIGYTYALTPKFSITPEVGSTIFQSKDGRDFFAHDIKYPEFAIYLDISL